MNRTKFTDLIKERVVVFDGAMGTELYQRHQFINICFDELCLTKPELVREIHIQNREAGADVLSTNSFGANRYKLGSFMLADLARDICRKAAEIAREAAGDELFVAGSIGPLGRVISGEGISFEEAQDAFGEAIEGLKEGGADFVIFETFSIKEEMLAAIYAATKTNMPYIPSMAPSTRNVTKAGERLESIAFDLPKDAAEPIMIGFNCGTGPKEMLEILEEFLPQSKYPVLVQPNAGFPQMVNHRLIYMASPEYLATYAERFVQLGARAVGGCCGTSHEHIKVLANSVKKIHRERAVVSQPLKKGVELQPQTPMGEKSRFARKLEKGEWATSVELVPPLGWDLTKTVERAALCCREGVDAINIPDGPRASSRISPMVTASAIQREAGIEALLHITCRDHNVIGMQSYLLGCAASGIKNLLIITGDPPKSGDYPFATAVFDLDSIGLTKMASRLNGGVDIGGQPVKPQTRFLIGVGADPSHIDQERELARFYQKAEAGAEFAITQPVYDPETLMRFIEKARGARIPIIGGIWPLASLANAEFLNNEVPGVKVPKNILERMAKARTKEEAREEGIAISREIIEAIRGFVAGVQVSAPFGNVKTALEVLK